MTCRKEQNDYSVISLKDPSCVFGITGKYIDFSNVIKLFCQRDNIDVSKKKCLSKNLNRISL